MDFAIPAPNDLTHTANEGTYALPHHITFRHTLDSPPRRTFAHISTVQPGPYGQLPL